MMSPNPFEDYSEDEESDEEEPFISNLTDKPCPRCGNLLFEAAVKVYWQHGITVPGLLCSDCCYSEYDEDLIEEYKEQFTKSGGVITEVRKEFKVKK